MFKLNKIGFTLVELLAVIVVLAIIMVIAIPNILGIIDKARNDSFASTAKMMIEAAKTKVASDNSIVLPVATNDVTIIQMTSLNLDNVTKDADGGTYGANSYVTILKTATGTNYYVTLAGSKRGLMLAKEGATWTVGLTAIAIAPTGGLTANSSGTGTSTFTTTQIPEATATATAKYVY